MEREWSAQQNRIFSWFAKDQSFFRTLHDYGDLEFLVDVNGHLIIRARAGTGKTTVLIEGSKRAPERSILVCAFSKIIQLELESRFLDPVTKIRTHPHIKAQTLHSVGYACIRKFKEGIKVEFNSTRADGLAQQVCGNTAPDVVKRLVSKLHTKGREIAPHATTLGDLTDIAITFECIPEESWEKSGFGAEYVEKKALEAMELAANIQTGATIDGSDMIFLPVRNHWLQGLYDLVLVDEAQDMTTAQLEIAQGVLNRGGRIAIIGDDRQAIFGFRGADSGSLDRLKIELSASELGLKTTYRCGHSIVELAQGLVPDFLCGAAHEGSIEEIYCNELTAAAGPGDFILSRINAPLVSVAMKLLRAGKRTRIAGKDIGKGLIALVRKLRPTSVPDYLRKTEAWADRECSRLQAQMEKATEGRKNTIRTKMEGINDQATMLTELAEGAKNVNEITDRIEALFSDDGLGSAGMITCSSIHKAKGLEASKVFVLRDTLRSYNQEELNLQYVGITRAKDTLVWVSDKREE